MELDLINEVKLGVRKETASRKYRKGTIAARQRKWDSTWQWLARLTAKGIRR